MVGLLSLGEPGEEGKPGCPRKPARQNGKKKTLELFFSLGWQKRTEVANCDAVRQPKFDSWFGTLKNEINKKTWQHCHQKHSLVRCAR